MAKNDVIIHAVLNILLSYQLCSPIKMHTITLPKITWYMKKLNAIFRCFFSINYLKTVFSFLCAFDPLVMLLLHFRKTSQSNENINKMASCLAPSIYLNSVIYPNFNILRQGK